MPKKLDRFERAVEKHVHTDQWNMPVIHAERAAKLLRAEHAWMWGTVKKYQKSVNGLANDLDPNFVSGYNLACYDFLDRLVQRRK